MSVLIENGVIEELSCGSNFAYVLKDNSSFLSTEYKVLQSQTNGSFVKCMKMLYNGQIELYYLVNTLKPLSSMIPHLDPDQLITIVRNLFSCVLDVKGNGFLTCQSIDSSFDHIFVDPNTYKVGLVYLPLKEHEYPDTAAFENSLRTSLVKLISTVSTLSSDKTKKLSENLQDGTKTIESLYSAVGGKAASPGRNAEMAERPVPSSDGESTMVLIAMNAPSRVEIPITKSEFRIGKKSDNDGIVDFNKMISRQHCIISKKGDQYVICDLQSANGTFVNGERLSAGKTYLLKNGDVVRLANSDFQVVIR